MALLQAVGRLAAGVGPLTEAEGIESAEQVSCLRDLGWALGQGYHFSPPVGADVIATLLAAPAASP